VAEKLAKSLEHRSEEEDDVWLGEEAQNITLRRDDETKGVSSLMIINCVSLWQRTMARL